jgi:hypothetical protein
MMRSVEKKGKGRISKGQVDARGKIRTHTYCKRRASTGGDDFLSKMWRPGVEEKEGEA